MLNHAVQVGKILPLSVLVLSCLSADDDEGPTVAKAPAETGDVAMLQQQLEDMRDQVIERTIDLVVSMLCLFLQKNSVYCIVMIYHCLTLGKFYIICR